MSLLSPWALAGLLLSIPLVVLHLRRRRPPVHEVPSLVAWRASGSPVSAAAKRFGRPAMPLLLALQLAALALLVLALARPVLNGNQVGATRVFVVDDSIWMQAREQGGTRLEAAEAAVRARLDRLPGDRHVAIVLAQAEPRVFFEGSAADAAEAVARIPTTFGAADLPAALALADGVPRDQGRVELLRAPEDPAPRTRAAPGSFGEVTVGAPIPDQGVAAASARCLRGSARCELLARVDNRSGTARRDRVTVRSGTRPLSTQTVEVPARRSAPVAFNAPAGAALSVALDGGDALPVDDRAYVAVPSHPTFRVTLVGEPTEAEPLARALLAVPGAKLTLRTPGDFRPVDVKRSDLLVVDGWLPSSATLAAAPAALLVDPPRLPGGQVGGTLADTRLSGTGTTSGILDGVDLTSLTIGGKGARRTVLPPWLRAVAWTPDGPLIGVGTDDGRRLGVVAFDPAESNLPQLSSFPRLIENLVLWSQQWAPAAVASGGAFLALRPPAAGATIVAGESGGITASRRTVLRLDRPGLYELRQAGPWGTRTRPIAANPELTPARADRAPVAIAASFLTGPAHGAELWRWLLLAAIAVLLVEAAIVVRVRPGPPAAFLVLRAAALLLLLAALVQPRLGSDGPGPTTVLTQHSPGLDPADAAGQRRWREAASECGADCRVRTTSADLEAGLDRAVAATPAGGRVVVLASGRQTDGDAEAAVASARARGVRLDVVPQAGSPRDVAVTRLQIPPALHAGDPLPVEVTVRSSAPGSATVTLLADGAPAGGRMVELSAGDNPFLLTPTAPGPGSHAYRVVVRAPGDTVAANDSLVATVRVAARPRALILGAAGGKLASMLSSDGIAVDTTPAAALPLDPAGLRRYDVVALDDVSAKELGSARAAALAAAVRRGDVGLVVFGGPDSFSLGRYYHSPLQAALPVSSLTPGNLQRKNLALELILDRSGSMSEDSAGVPKIEMARTAARTATAFVVNHKDRLGVVAFDAEPHVLVPPTRLTSTAEADQVNRAIDAIQAEGGTNIYAALRAGVRQIEADPSKNRHIVLLSDGISEKGSYATLVPQLHREDITVSTVALGSEADTELLKGIADATGGHFYATEDPRKLPKIFAKDVLAAARPVRLKGRIGVAPGEDSPVVRDLGGKRLPPLRGNVVTTLKPGAQAVLLGEDKDHAPDPVLAQWQYGSGRVVAWTPGLGTWAGGWAGFGKVWADAARWVEPGVAPSRLAPRPVRGDESALEVDEAGAAHPASTLTPVTGSLKAPGEPAAPLDFEAAEPWRWTAPMANRALGLRAYAVRDGDRTERGLLALPYSGALRPLPADATPLGTLAAATGGEVLSPAAAPDLNDHGFRLWWWLALAALLCFLADVGVRMLDLRRSASPSGGASPADGTRSAPGTRSGGGNEPPPPVAPEQQVERV